MTKLRIQIEGMRCQGCKTRIETEVGALEGVKQVRADYATGEGVVEFDESKVSVTRIFKTIKALGYRVKRAPERRDPAQDGVFIPRRWLAAGGLLILFALAYLAVQQLSGLELLARLNEKNLSYGLIFVIGLLSSFHCVGMCGGLVVTYTAGQQNQVSGKGRSLLPHLQYNTGRAISYTALGALLGGFGSFFAISPTFTGIITLLAGVFMVLMGLSLATDFRWLGSLELHMPAFVGRFLYGNQRSANPKGPFIIGLLNGFMPCGPLQAMQLYALTTGSAARGALSMALYALGTVPLMFGFGSVISMLSKERTRQMAKVSGLVVIALGMLMLSRGMANFGRAPSSPVANVRPNSTAAPTAVTVQPTPDAAPMQGYQVVRMQLTRRGYEPNVLYAKAGIPVRWVIDVKEMSGCTNELIMPDYNIRIKFKYGENVVEFTPKKPGEIKFSCWMRMVWGKFVIEA